MTEIRKHELEPVPDFEGLVQCKVCGAAEGELPTECPNRKMTIEECADVMSGDKDFIAGVWINYRN